MNETVLLILATDIILLIVVVIHSKYIINNLVKIIERNHLRFDELLHSYQESIKSYIKVSELYEKEAEAHIETLAILKVAIKKEKI